MSDGAWVAVVGLALTLLVHASVMFRWSGKLQAIVEQLQEGQRDIRKLVDRHDIEIDSLKLQIAVNQAVRDAVENMGKVK